MTNAKFMADDFHSYFIEKKGTGKNKNASLQSFQNWDAPLHPQINIFKYKHYKNVYTVMFNEQNDFSKLIDFPRMERNKNCNLQFKKIN